MATVRALITSASWVAILVVCISICFQLLGVPGTMLDLGESEDDFQTSIMVGYTITSNMAPLLLSLTSFLVSIDNMWLPPLSLSLSIYHPPLFV